MRTRARLLGFGLSTIFGIRRRGFFIPYRYADRLPRGERRPYIALEQHFAAAESALLDLVRRMDAHAAALTAIGQAPEQPRWTQDWFPRLDAAAAYVLVRDMRPKRIVEVGSGHSTRFIARAIRDGGSEVDLTSIDPAPRAAIEATGAKLLRRTVQDVGAAPFQALAAGDMLFIDSSHILMPGTDVDVLFNRVLPALPAGVLVHIHDIFLPDGYPSAWDWRGYNEQLAVAALLQGSGYRIVWASHYAATRMGGTIAASTVGRLPLMSGALESSLWLRKEA